MKQKVDLSHLVTKSYLDEVVRGIDEKAQRYRDEILAKMDEVMGELGVMREENTIGSHQTSQLRDTVENHKKRIKNIEKIQQTT